MYCFYSSLSELTFYYSLFQSRLFVHSLLLYTDINLISQTFHKLPWLTESTLSNERLSSKNVREFAQSQGYDVTTVDIPVHWDITEVFDDQSDFGNKLLDFFTQAAYFRETAPSEVVDDLMSFWRSISTEDENGRILAPAHDEILLISK